MKKVFVLCLILILLISCEDLEHTNPLHPDYTAELTIDKTEANVSNGSGSFTVKVISNGNWTVSSAANWLTASPNSGNNNGTITVNYTENTESSERSGTISVVGGGITRTCNIYQESLYGMIFIQGGTYQMGSTDGDSDERPVHTVTVSDFYMSKYEVTQKLYEELMGTNPSYFTGENLPVELISWYDAVAFCNALSDKEGLTPVYTINGTSVTWDQNADGYRLPTEAEWEYAAGGGSSNRSKWAGTDSESSLSNYAWYNSNSGSQTHPAGTKEPNSLGLYDMSGNVLEWCWDWYGTYSSSSQTNPAGPVSGPSRVLRGGSWVSSATYCRVAYRYSNAPSRRHNLVGFRLVRKAP